MLQIAPQEFHLLQDNPYIRTKCPQSDITDEMIVRHVKRGNLVAGDTVLVQCMNSDYTDLLAEAEYRVTSRKTKLVTYETGDSTRQAEEVTFRVERWSEWRRVAGAVTTASGKTEIYATPGGDWVDPTTAPAAAGMRTKWNIGARVYDIMMGDVKIGSHADKETAAKIASGELPLEV
jgi:hypothetical protein